MADLAKIFTSGGRQAVRLPKKYRFPDEGEVLVSRQGHRVILEPLRKAWSSAFVQLAGSAPGFTTPADAPAVEPVQELGAGA